MRLGLLAAVWFLVGCAPDAARDGITMDEVLLKLRREGGSSGEVGTRIRNMRERVEAVLAKGRQLEL